MYCDYCKNEIKPSKARYNTGGRFSVAVDTISMPFICKRCGGSFCSKHRLPENHDCVGLKPPIIIDLKNIDIAAKTPIDKQSIGDQENNADTKEYKLNELEKIRRIKTSMLNDSQGKNKRTRLLNELFRLDEEIDIIKESLDIKKESTPVSKNKTNHICQFCFKSIEHSQKCQKCGLELCQDHIFNHSCIKALVVEDDFKKEKIYTKTQKKRKTIKNFKAIIFFILIVISGYLITPYLIGVEHISEPSDFNHTIETFLTNDLTDDQKFEFKSTYAKTLYENAFNNDFILGGIILHTGYKNYNEDTRYVLNYYITDNSFIIINPQNDKIYTLSEFSSSPDFPKTFRYLTLFPDVLSIPNYKLTKQTREFDRENPIVDIEIIKKVDKIYIYEPQKEIQEEETQQEESQFEYPTNYLDLIKHKFSYFIAGVEQKTTEYEQSYELSQECKDKKVYDSYGGYYIVGAKGDIKYLDNNCDAKDVSYSEVISFVLKDDTDKMRYDYSSFVCADYAEMLHNNAESNGIKCAYVSITNFNSDGHALNAFNTIDKGMIYIDCTGSLDGSSMDNIAIIKHNAIYYTPLYNSNYYLLPSYMDVENIEVIW